MIEVSKGVPGEWTLYQAPERSPSGQRAAAGHQRRSRTRLTL